MNRHWKITSITITMLILSGCLVTRDQVRESPTRTPSPSDSVSPAQINKAQQAVRVDELEESLRQALGRVEVLENQLSQVQQSQQSAGSSETMKAADAQQKFTAYEEALKSLEAQVQTLNQELQKAKAPAAGAQAKSSSIAEKSDKSDKNGNYASAEEAFNSRDWKKAIVGYQKYRDLNPKGKWYADATYKIGVSFQELGMNNEAKAFFDEVVAKFPAGKPAEKAKYRLKNLK